MGLPDEVVQIPVAFETVPAIIKEVDMNEASLPFSEKGVGKAEK